MGQKGLTLSHSDESQEPVLNTIYDAQLNWSTMRNAGRGPFNGRPDLSFINAQILFTRIKPSDPKKASQFCTYLVLQSSKR